jgi:hypothetical protein
VVGVVAGVVAKASGNTVDPEILHDLRASCEHSEAMVDCRPAAKEYIAAYERTHNRSYSFAARQCLRRACDKPPREPECNCIDWSRRRDMLNDTERACLRDNLSDPEW